MSKDFYNKIAKKFGGYSYGTHNPNYTKEFPDGVPEDDFKNHLLNLSGKDKTALDIGCGDCKFAFSISQNFKEIVGIDNSTELLKVAKAKQKELNNNNFRILRMNANKMSFKNESVDLAYSRRGPTPYKEVVRILKPSGYFVIIEIGDKDTMELKKVFGRGQNYGKWNKSVLKEGIKEAERVGLKTIFSKDYFYDEYYETYQDLDLFLQGVPIFEDFDSEKDMVSLTQYTESYQTEKGIRLPRHRVVFIFQKT